MNPKTLVIINEGRTGKITAYMMFKVNKNFIFYHTGQSSFFAVFVHARSQRT